MQTAFIFLVWVTLLGIGAYAPFAFGLAYIWVDFFRPQDVASGFIKSIPVSMITAGLGFLVYCTFDRKALPRLNAMTGLLLVWLVWITLTTTWAVFPDPAWKKWDWASKTVLFSMFLPFLFRSRVQIEAAILTVVCAIFSNVIPFGLKTMLGTGGYGRPLGLVPINGGWGGEGSTLAIYAISSIPLINFLASHSLILGHRRASKVGFLIAPVVAIMGGLGTFARAGLVSTFVWALCTWWQSRRKLLLAVVFAATGAVVFSVLGDRWTARMSTTVEAEQESSAYTRLLVWGWTIDYAREHPLGGGFDVYLLNRRFVLLPDGSEFVVEGRAFHSMYFEILGEQGIVGACIFILVILTFYFNIYRLARRCRNAPELSWVRGLCVALAISATSYFAGAAFVGVAFQPLHYFMFAMSVCLLNYARRFQLGQPMSAQEQGLGWTDRVGAENFLPSRQNVRDQPAMAVTGGQRWRARAAQSTALRSGDQGRHSKVQNEHGH